MLMSQEDFLNSLFMSPSVDKIVEVALLLNLVILVLLLYSLSQAVKIAKTLIPLHHIVLNVKPDII